VWQAVGLSAGWSGQVFFHGDTAGLAREHFCGEGNDALCRLLARNPSPMDIGNQVSVRIRVPAAWFVCHIRRQTLCGSQTRPFANQKNGDLGSNEVPDIIEHADAAMTDQKRLTERPGGSFGLAFDEWQQFGCLHNQGGRGQAITEHDLEVGVFRTSLSDLKAGWLAKLTAQIRAHKEFRFGACSSFDTEQVPMEEKGMAEMPFQIDLCVNGVESRGVVFAQVQLGAGPVSRSCMPDH
jgi:hypothetical protein